MERETSDPYSDKMRHWRDYIDFRRNNGSQFENNISPRKNNVFVFSDKVDYVLSIFITRTHG